MYLKSAMLSVGPYEFYSPDDKIYQALPEYITGPVNNTGSISFAAQAWHDVHVSLTPSPGADGYEIVIAGWSNSMSVLRALQGDTIYSEIYHR